MAAEGQEWSQSRDAQRLSGWHRAEKRLGVGQGKSRMGLESIPEQLLGALVQEGMQSPACSASCGQVREQPRLCFACGQALLLAAGAAGSVPAATPSWPRAAAAWDRASASPPPKRGVLPAVSPLAELWDHPGAIPQAPSPRCSSSRSPQARGPGASEEPANASGRHGSAGHAAGRCSGARAEAGAADGARPFTNPPPCW